MPSVLHVIEALVFSVVFSFLLRQVAGDGKLQVRLVRYDNPSGKGDNGHCCDGRFWFCEPRGCDYYFQLCLDSFYGTDSMTSCSIGRHTTGSTQNQDSVQFGSLIGNTANPFEILFSEWNNGMKIRVHVWDEDGRTRHDFVDSMRTHIMVAAAESESVAHWTPFVIRARTSLTAELRVFCTTGYYGPSCNVYCRPGDRFNCSSSGQKLCLPGWTGSDCTSVDACVSSPCENGAECHSDHDTYFCSCPLHFTGRNCESGISGCDNETCLNGGQCHMLSSDARYMCRCPVEWTGERCETRLETCPLNCLHQGECVFEEGKFICRCQLSWSGDDCGIRSYVCQPGICLNNATSCIADEDGFTCICNVGFKGERCEIQANDDFDSVTNDTVDTGDDFKENEAERLFVFDGRLHPKDAEHLVFAIANHSNSHLQQQLDCDGTIDVDYRLEYCTGESGSDLTLFFFDLACNSTHLNWTVVEELFNSMSPEEFHQMLPLQLSEDADCVPGTRASSSALKSTTVATWIVPTVIALVVVMVVVLGTFFIVHRCRRRKLSTMPVAYEQPLYSDIYLDHRDGNYARMTTDAPRVPNVYMMCSESDDDSQPPALAGNPHIDDWLHTYDNITTR